MPDEQFKAIVLHKENIVNKGDGATIINEDGSITKDAARKQGHESTNKFSSYQTSKEAILNYRYDIDGFIPFIGEPFRPALESIKKSLEEFGVINPKPYSLRVYRNNKTTIWHRHTIPANTHRSKFWITIFYLHPNWNEMNGGSLQIGITDQEIILDAPCLSNSVAAHNGYYGHGVKTLKLGYEGDRDIMLTHWVSE